MAPWQRLHATVPMLRKIFQTLLQFQTTMGLWQELLRDSKNSLGERFDTKLVTRARNHCDNDSTQKPSRQQGNHVFYLQEARLELRRSRSPPSPSPIPRWRRQGTAPSTCWGLSLSVFSKRKRQKDFWDERFDVRLNGLAGTPESSRASKT